MKLMAGACVALLAVVLPAAWGAPPQEAAARDVLRTSIDAYAPRMAQVAHEIWEHPELGYLETRASKLLQDELAAAGFEVQAGIAGMPTAFVASAGNGKGPVIALLAEMYALPGMSQASLPEHAPVAGQDAVHACGHNLFGAGSVAAARAIAPWLRGTDRTSVVEGKSVSGRVDLGGRGLITKKHNTL